MKRIIVGALAILTLTAGVAYAAAPEAVADWCAALLAACTCCPC